MNGVKPWRLSKSLWGGLAAVLVFVMQWFGISLDQATVADILMQIGGTIGAIVAVWGRAVATEKIRWKE